MIKLSKIIKEVVDILPIQDLEKNGISYSIEIENARKFEATLEYKESYYILSILPIYNQKTPTINFGSTDSNYFNINLSKLTKSPYSLKILSAIFGLIRYWVDKYNVQEFNYLADGQVRKKLYSYYLEKHFKDFKNYKQEYGHNFLEKWKKI